MFLFEFNQDSVQVSKIIALTNQLKHDIDNGEGDPDNFSLEDLLQYFQMYDVILDKNDLYNMIKVNPLKSLISNIEGDKIAFKGHEPTPSETPPDENQKTVANMAKSAMKK